MVHTGQRWNTASHVFDLVQRNLPKQETDEDGEPLGVLEFIIWMLGISAGIVVLQYLSHLLF